MKVKILSILLFAVQIGFGQIYIDSYRFAGEVDPFFSNVSLLLHMEGANNSTTFTDDSNNNFTVTANGDAQISTAESKFGSASGKFDGNADFLSVPSNTNNAVGTGDWTIECWIYAQNITGSAGIIGLSTLSATQGIVLRRGAGDKIQFWVNGYNGFIQSTSIISTNTWYHLALVRNGTTNSLYINGVKDVTSSITPVFGSNTNYVVGKSYTDYDLDVFEGYIDDVRITKGVARYTSNFTPPATQFPDN